MSALENSLWNEQLQELSAQELVDKILDDQWFSEDSERREYEALVQKIKEEKKWIIDVSHEAEHTLVSQLIWDLFEWVNMPSFPMYSEYNGETYYDWSLDSGENILVNKKGEYYVNGDFSSEKLKLKTLDSSEKLINKDSKDAIPVMSYWDPGYNPEPLPVRPTSSNLHWEMDVIRDDQFSWVAPAPETAPLPRRKPIQNIMQIVENQTEVDSNFYWSEVAPTPIKISNTNKLVLSKYFKDINSISNWDYVDFLNSLDSWIIFPNSDVKGELKVVLAFVLQGLTSKWLWNQSNIWLIDLDFWVSSKNWFKKFQENVLWMDPNDMDRSKRPDWVFWDYSKERIVKYLSNNLNDTVKFIESDKEKIKPIHTDNWTDLRLYSWIFPNEASVKNNNPSWLTYNSVFSSTLQRNWINHFKWTSRPTNEWGNYFWFPTIEDGINAHNILWSIKIAKFSNSKLWDLLSSWAVDTESYKSKFWDIWNSNVWKIAKDQPSVFREIQLWQLKIESPWMYSTLVNNSLLSKYDTSLA